ncbi:MAG: hypothetical protein K8T25_16295 [Planctomycetia bacterium]|nr:hypothetical protein [Planctomycetia bacterium]
MMRLWSPIHLLILGWCALTLHGWTSSAFGADAVFREDFEGIEPSWQLRAADARYRVNRHERVREPVHGGAWSETLALSAADGTFIHFGRDIGAARVIDELNISLQVLSDRSGLQLICRVVLPRTRDPQTSGPRTLMVYGPMYDKPGEWQALVISHLPQQLERQARIVQSGETGSLDIREAYVDTVLLNVYGGRGETQVWIDDLAIAGFVGRSAVVAGEGTGSAAALARGAADGTQRSSEIQRVDHEEPASQRVMPEVSLRGGALTSAGRPLFPRLIEYRGEPLAALKKLGFNGIKLSSPPDGPLLAEATDTRMWIVCPPPEQRPGTQFGRQYDPVLAWDVGRSLGRDQIATTEATVRWLKQTDREVRRPIICDAATDLRSYSELADILLMGRRTLGTSLELADSVMWHQRRARSAQPGTPVWFAIPTQPDAGWLNQISAVSDAPAPVDLRGRQLRQLACAAICGGARGLVFESRESLDADDPASRRRAMLLKLINIELSLVENWAAAGSFVMPATSSDPAITAGVLQTDRARLLLAMRLGRGDQFVIDESRGGEVTFVVPGVPESNDAFELTPAGLRPLPHRRVTGGMSVTMRNPPPAAFVLLTQDPLVIDSLSRLATQERPRAAELTRQLAADELAMVAAVDRQMTARSRTVPEAGQWLEQARDRLRQCDAALQTGDYPQALALGREAMPPLARLARAHWQKTVKPLGSPLTIPAATSIETLPQCAALADALRSSTIGENRLQGGELEDLDQLRRGGWQHFQIPQRRLAVDVELSTQAPHGGAHSLRLSSKPKEGTEPPMLVEAPPLWVTSAPVALEARQMVQIHGWVRVPRPITGSVDGLMIVDSLGGEALAERIGQTRGWQEFTLYRAASQSGNVTVTFALTGIGEASIDDVTIRPVTLPPTFSTAVIGSVAPR